jgi:hypothetical protein
VTIGDRTNAAAGHDYVELLFTNTSGRPCTLTGYPGVSYLNGSGEQVGPAAARDVRGAPAPVQLAPQAVAYARITMPHTGVFGPSGSSPCKAVDTTGIRVYPPGSFDAVTVLTSQSICTGPVDPGQGRTLVGVVTAGRMP